MLEFHTLVSLVFFEDAVSSSQLLAGAWCVDSEFHGHTLQSIPLALSVQSKFMCPCFFFSFFSPGIPVPSQNPNVCRSGYWVKIALSASAGVALVFL